MIEKDEEEVRQFVEGTTDDEQAEGEEEELKEHDEVVDPLAFGNQDVAPKTEQELPAAVNNIWQHLSEADRMVWEGARMDLEDAWARAAAMPMGAAARTV